ncbi:hypothetical protein EK474_02305 [Escherichia coli]|nr:hypothetical protein EK474_02305 [Escherichia coli]
MCIYLNLMILIKIIRGFIRPQHPYLNDVPLIDELRHQNTHHVILLTLDVAKKNTQPNNII